LILLAAKLREMRCFIRIFLKTRKNRSKTGFFSALSDFFNGENFFSRQDLKRENFKLKKSLKTINCLITKAKNRSK